MQTWRIETQHFSCEELALDDEGTEFDLRITRKADGAQRDTSTESSLFLRDILAVTPDDAAFINALLSRAFVALPDMDLMHQVAEEYLNRAREEKHRPRKQQTKKAA
ncbi:MAG: hypothetical protein J0H40_03970 [Rhizobiales bacterium]|nr:hypothetical protein [Hyphomicrobiales bacterium]